MGFIHLTLGYLAGFLDGEGYASVARIPRGESYEYCLRIAIYNSNLSVLHGIRQTWGGNLSQVPSRRANWKPGFALIWTNAAAAGLLSEVGPYLRIKSRQARLMVQFQKHVQNTRRTRDPLGRLLPLSVREREKREGFYELLKSLNRKGPTTLPDGQVAHTRNLGSQASQSISLEYLAGFIDGEGSLMLVKALRKTPPKYAYVPRLNIDNTNRVILETIRRRYGGTIYENRRREAGWKTVYKLSWIGRDVEPVLRSVAPHLYLKRGHAKTLLDFIDHARRTDDGRIGRYAPVSGRTMAYRDALYRQMKALNARGPPRRFGSN